MAKKITTVELNMVGVGAKKFLQELRNGAEQARARVAELRQKMAELDGTAQGGRKNLAALTNEQLGLYRRYEVELKNAQGMQKAFTAAVNAERTTINQLAAALDNLSGMSLRQLLAAQKEYQEKMKSFGSNKTAAGAREFYDTYEATYRKVSARIAELRQSFLNLRKEAQAALKGGEELPLAKWKEMQAALKGSAENVGQNTRQFHELNQLAADVSVRIYKATSGWAANFGNLRKVSDETLRKMIADTEQFIGKGELSRREVQGLARELKVLRGEQTGRQVDLVRAVIGDPSQLKNKALPEIRKAIEQARQLQNAPETGSRLWRELDAGIVQATAHLQQMAKSGAESVMVGQMRRIRQVSDEALAAMRKLFEQRLAYSRDNGEEQKISLYESRLKKVNAEEQRRVELLAKAREMQMTQQYNAAQKNGFAGVSSADLATMVRYFQEAANGARQGSEAYRTYTQRVLELKKAQAASAQTVQVAAMTRELDALKKKYEETKAVSASALESQRQFWQAQTEAPGQSIAQLDLYRQRLTEVGQLMKRQAADRLGLSLTDNGRMVKAQNADTGRYDQLKLSEGVLRQIQEGTLRTVEELNKAKAAVEAYKNTFADTRDVVAMNALNGAIARVEGQLKVATREIYSMKQVSENLDKIMTGRWSGTTSEIDKMTRSLKQYEAEARKAGDTSAANRMALAIRNIKTNIDTTRVSAEEFNRILSKPRSTRDLEKLQYVYDTLKARIIAAGNATAQQIQQLRMLDRQIRSTNEAIGLHASTLEQAFSRLKSYIMIYMGFNAMMMKVRQTVEANLHLADSISNVQKVSGMAQYDINKLSDALQGLNTRTKSSVLMDIAYQGAKMGVAVSGDLETIRQFTEAANKLNSALGEDFGGAEAIGKLTKLAQTMGVASRDCHNLNEALERTGSAILTLGNNTTANYSYINQFATRVAGIAKAANISMPNLLAIGATMDQMGMQAEMSATAMSKMIATLSKNPEGMATALKMTGENLERFNAAARSGDTMTQLMTVFRQLDESGANLKDIANVLKDMVGGGNNTRALQVLTAMAANYDALANNVDMANESFAEGTAIQKEYEIMNENAAASAARLGNAISEIFVNSGAADSFGRLLKSLARTFEWFQNHLPTLTMLLAGLGLTVKVLGKEFQATFAAAKAGILETQAAGSNVSFVTKLRMSLSNMARSISAAFRNMNVTESLKNAFTSLWTSIKAGAVAAAQTMKVAFSAAVVTIKSLMSSVAVFALIEGVMYLIAKLKEAWDEAHRLGKAIREAQGELASENFTKGQELVSLGARLRDLQKKLVDARVDVVKFRDSFPGKKDEAAWESTRKAMGKAAAEAQVARSTNLATTKAFNEQRRAITAATVELIKATDKTRGLSESQKKLNDVIVEYNGLHKTLFDLLTRRYELEQLIDKGIIDRTGHILDEAKAVQLANEEINKMNEHRIGKDLIMEEQRVLSKSITEDAQIITQIVSEIYQDKGTTSEFKKKLDKIGGVGVGSAYGQNLLVAAAQERGLNNADVHNVNTLWNLLKKGQGSGFSRSWNPQWIQVKDKVDNMYENFNKYLGAVQTIRSIFDVFKTTTGETGEEGGTEGAGLAKPGKPAKTPKTTTTTMTRDKAVPTVTEINDTKKVFDKAREIADDGSEAIEAALKSRISIIEELASELGMDARDVEQRRNLVTQEYKGKKNDYYDYILTGDERRRVTTLYDMDDDIIRQAEDILRRARENAEQGREPTEKEVRLMDLFDELENYEQQVRYGAEMGRTLRTDRTGKATLEALGMELEKFYQKRIRETTTTIRTRYPKTKTRDAYTTTQKYRSAYEYYRLKSQQVIKEKEWQELVGNLADDYQKRATAAEKELSSAEFQAYSKMLDAYVKSNAYKEWKKNVKDQMYDLGVFTAGLDMKGGAYAAELQKRLDFIFRNFETIWTRDIAKVREMMRENGFGAWVDTLTDEQLGILMEKMKDFDDLFQDLIRKEAEKVNKRLEAGLKIGRGNITSWDISVSRSMATAALEDAEAAGRIYEEALKTVLEKKEKYEKFLYYSMHPEERTTSETAAQRRERKQEERIRNAVALRDEVETYMLENGDLFEEGKKPGTYVLRAEAAAFRPKAGDREEKARYDRIKASQKAMDALMDRAGQLGEAYEKIALSARLQSDIDAFLSGDQWKYGSFNALFEQGADGTFRMKDLAREWVVKEEDKPTAERPEGGMSYRIWQSIQEAIPVLEEFSARARKLGELYDYTLYSEAGSGGSSLGEVTVQEDITGDYLRAIAEADRLKRLYNEAVGNYNALLANQKDMEEYARKTPYSENEYRERTLARMDIRKEWFGRSEGAGLGGSLIGITNSDEEQRRMLLRQIAFKTSDIKAREDEFVIKYGARKLAGADLKELEQIRKTYDIAQNKLLKERVELEKQLKELEEDMALKILQHLKAYSQVVNEAMTSIGAAGTEEARTYGLERAKLNYSLSRGGTDERQQVVEYKSDGTYRELYMSQREFLKYQMQMEARNQRLEATAKLLDELGKKASEDITQMLEKSISRRLREALDEETEEQRIERLRLEATERQKTAEQQLTDLIKDQLEQRASAYREYFDNLPDLRAYFGLPEMKKGKAAFTQGAVVDISNPKGSGTKTKAPAEAVSAEHKELQENTLRLSPQLAAEPEVKGQEIELTPIVDEADLTPLMPKLDKERFGFASFFKDESGFFQEKFVAPYMEGFDAIDQRAAQSYERRQEQSVRTATTTTRQEAKEDDKKQKHQAKMAQSMAAAMNMYGITYSTVMNDSLNAQQKTGMIALQSVGQVTTQLLTALLSEMVAKVAAGEASGTATLFGSMPYPAALALVAAMTATLGAAMGLATKKITKSKKEVAAATGAGGGKLTAGMLTYASGRYPADEEERLRKGMLTFGCGRPYAKGKSYSVDGDDGRTYSARYEGDIRHTGIRRGTHFGIFSEKKPEMVVDGVTTDIIHKKYPALENAILSVARTGSLNLDMLGVDFDKIYRSVGLLKASGALGGAGRSRMPAYADGAYPYGASAMNAAAGTADSGAAASAVTEATDSNAAIMRQLTDVIALLNAQLQAGIGVNMWGNNGLSKAMEKAERFKKRNGIRG